MEMAEKIEAIENGKGIQFLLNAAFEIFNNPLYVIDIDYNMLSFVGGPVDDPVWNEIVTTGTYSMETLEMLAKENFIEDVTNAERSIICKSDKLKYSRISDRFYNRDNIPAGMVTMYESNVPLGTEHIAAFEKLADKITKEIRNHEYFISLAITFYEEKINMLLDGIINDPLIYNSKVQVLYNGFEDYLYIAVIGLEKNNIQDDVHQSRLKYFQSMLKTRYPSFKYSVYKDHIVMLMSSKNRDFYGLPLFTSNTEFFGENGLSLGISGSFENMYELRQYYDNAASALEKGRTPGNGRIFIYNDT